MIRFEVNGILGYGVSPAIEEPLVSQILWDVPRGSRIAVIDLALTDNLSYLLDEATQMGHRVVSVITEHAPYYPRQYQFAGRLRRQLGLAARIVSRRVAGSSTALVQEGEFRGLADVVFFHAGCMDGFLSFSRGCGCSYTSAVYDANILDSGAGGNVVTPVGKLLADAVSSLVLPYNVWPHEYEEAWLNIGENLLRVMRGGGDVSAVPAFAREVQRAHRTARELAHTVADSSRRLPGAIGLGDMRSQIERGRVVHRSTWRRRLQSQMGEVLYSALIPNPFGDVAHVSRPETWKVDLRQLTPPGIGGHSAFRVRVPLSRWPEFCERVLRHRGQAQGGTGGRETDC